MIPALEEIILGLIAGTVTKDDAWKWIHAHFELWAEREAARQAGKPAPLSPSRPNPQEPPPQMKTNLAVGSEQQPPESVSCVRPSQAAGSVAALRAERDELSAKVTELRGAADLLRGDVQVMLAEKAVLRAERDEAVNALRLIVGKWNRGDYGPQASPCPFMGLAENLLAKVQP